MLGKTMTVTEFETLLNQHECEWLDWKKDFTQGLINGRSDPNWDKEKAVLVKDVVCIANSIFDRRGYVIYGVEDQGSSRVVHTISKTWDDAVFQQWFPGYVSPAVDFTYSEFEYESGKTVGVFEIIPAPEFPHVFTSTVQGVFQEGQVWFRRGSENKIADYDNIKRMFAGIEPMVLERLDGNPIFEETKRYYESMGQELVVVRFTQRDQKLHDGYVPAYYPNTRREIHFVDAFAMVKPEQD